MSCRLLSRAGIIFSFLLVAAPAFAQAPTGVEAHTNGSGTIDVTWTAVAGASSYKVYCYTQSGGPYGTASSVASTSTHKYFNNLNDTLTYYCAVTTVISGVESAKSTEVSACSGSAQLSGDGRERLGPGEHGDGLSIPRRA